jgi:hypothetical protein
VYSPGATWIVSPSCAFVIADINAAELFTSMIKTTPPW